MPEDSGPAVQPFRVCETHIHQCVSPVCATTRLFPMGGMLVRRIEGGRAGVNPDPSGLSHKSATNGLT